MAEIAQTADQWGRAVVLTDARWRHILGRHPDMARRLTDVMATVSGPDFIMRDVKHARRENFYRDFGGVGKRPRPYVKDLHRVRTDRWYYHHGIHDAVAETGRATTMALTNQAAVYPPLPPIRWPDHSLINPADMLINYDSVTDSLAIAFGGRVQPATIDPVDGDAGDYVSLRIDLENGEDVVGIEIENVGMALARHPSWRPVVEAAPTETRMSRVSSSAWPALAALVADIDRLSEQWPRVKPEN